MDAFSRSWRLLRESYAVLKRTPQLMVLPLISGFLSLIVGATFIVPLVLMSGGHQTAQEIKSDPLYYVVSFGFYLVTSFIVIFFNSALVTCAHGSLMGREVGVKEGLQNATRHLGPILGWALISATVGMVLRTLSERSGLIGRLVVAFLGAAWGLLTYFVIPIMVVDGIGPVQALKNSSALLKRTWGEQIGGNLGIGSALMIASLLGVIPIVLGFMAGGPVGIIGGLIAAVLYWMLVAIIGSALTGIYQTALYVYASTGTVPEGFTPEYIQGAFVPRKTNFGRV
jgi:hypothetical protein